MAKPKAEQPPKKVGLGEPNKPTKEVVPLPPKEVKEAAAETTNESTEEGDEFEELLKDVENKKITDLKKNVETLSNEVDELRAELHTVKSKHSQINNQINFLLNDNNSTRRYNCKRHLVFSGGKIPKVGDGELEQSMKKAIYDEYKIAVTSAEIGKLQFISETFHAFSQPKTTDFY